MFRRSNRHVFCLSSLLCALILSVGSAWATDSGDNIPARGEVTMIDLGADNCLPCRMMTPIIADLKKAYQGKATIVFIDIYRENEKARKFHAMVIPTQIFFDRDTKEIYRHSGAMDKGDIIKQLDSMLAKK